MNLAGYFCVFTDARQQLPGVHALPSDAGDPVAIGRLHEEVIGRFPKLNILINDAGEMRKISLHDPSIDLLDITREVDVVAGAEGKNWPGLRRNQSGQNGRCGDFGLPGGESGPAFFSFLPRFPLRPLTKAFLNSEEKKGPDPYTPTRTLISSMRYDFKVVVDRGNQVDTYRSVTGNVLLLGGSQSPDYPKKALDALEKRLPHNRRIEFNGLDHSAP